MRVSLTLAVATGVVTAHVAASQDSLPPPLRTKIDAEVAAVRTATGAPSVSPPSISGRHQAGDPISTEPFRSI